MNIRRLASCWLLLAGLLVPSWARAEEPLDFVPAQAGAVIRFASLDKLTGGFSSMVGALGPVGALAAPGFESGVNGMFQIQSDREAVDRTVPAWVVAFVLIGEPQPAAYLVRTADEARLRRAVLRAGADEKLEGEKRDDGFEKLVKDDRTWYFGRRGDWVVYTSSEAVVKQLAFDPAQQKTFASLVEPRAAEILMSGDAAAMVNLHQLNEVLDAQIAEGRDNALRGIENLNDQQLGGDPTNAKGARQALKELANLAFESLADARWIAGHVDFSEAGVGAAARLGVIEGSGTDQLLAANPASPLDSLGLLPAGGASYFGYAVNTAKLADWTRRYSQAVYGESSAQTKGILESLEQSTQAGGGPVVGSFSLSSAGSVGLVSSKLQPAEKPELLRNSARAYSAATVDTQNPLFKQSVEFKEKAETYKDRPIDVMTTTFEMKANNDEGAVIGQRLITKLFGGTTLATRMELLEGLLVQVTSNDPKNLQNLVDGLESGEGVAGLDEAFTATRDQLAEQANLVFMINVPRFVSDGINLIRDIPPFDMLLANAPINVGAQPAVSYGGVTVGAEPQGLQVQLFVPIGQPKGVMQIFGQGF